MSPQHAFYIMLGVETLGPRMDRHVANARAVAEMLESREDVPWVAWPGLASHPDHALAEKLLPHGSGAVISFGAPGGREGGRALIAKLSVFSHLANVGDAKSLVIHPASTTHAQLDEAGLQGGGCGRGPGPIVGRSRAPRRSPGRPQAAGWMPPHAYERPSRREQGACMTDGGRPFEPGKPTVILLHGAGMDHTVWSLPARWFAHHGYGVCVPDFPGTREEAKARPLGTVSDLADWTIALLSGIGCRPGPGGWTQHGRLGRAGMRPSASGACSVHWLYSVQRPPCPYHPRLLEAAAEQPALAAAMMTEWGHAEAARLGGGRTPGVWMTGGARRLLVQAPEGTLHAALRLCNAYADGLDAATAVAAPTRVVSGSDDRMTPAREGRRLSAAISGAEFEVIRRLRTHDDG